ncbi:P-loop containing nucleoside triphosphate hydrolase protein [Mrakia frigida]|uniref:ABC transporter ATP-binding protein n=1 Tax=Mrakia frigida TaxID=29902 RepID=UPI003FCC0C73
MACSSTLARNLVQSSSSVASSSSSSFLLLGPSTLRASLPSTSSSHLFRSFRTFSTSSYASSPILSIPTTRKRISPPPFDLPQPSSSSSSSLLLLASRRHLNSTPQPSSAPLKPPNPTPPSSPTETTPTTPAVTTEPPSKAAVVVEKIKVANPLTIIGQTKDFFSLAPFDTTSKSKQEQEEEARGSYKKLWELLLPEKKPIILGLLALSVGSITGNLLPYCIGKLMDYYGHAVTPELTFLGLNLPWTIAALSGMLLVGSVAALARSVLLEMSGQRIVARLRKRAYNSVLHQEIEFTDSKAGSIVSRLSNDCTVLGENLTDSLQSGSRDLFAFVIALGFMFYISVPVTFVALAVIPSTTYLSYKYGNYQRRIGKVTQESVGEMTKVAEEKLSFVRIIAAYNAQELESKTFSKKVDTIFAIARREIWMEGLMTDIYERIVTNHMAELSIILVGGYMVQTGSMTLGSLTALLMYQYSLQGSATGLVGFWAGLNKGLGAGVRVFELIDRKPQVAPVGGLTLAGNRTGTVKLKDIAFSYPSRPESMILRKINLEIAKGESVALCGGSGSGKSSIQNLILRFYEPNSGSIEFDGTDITDFNLASYRSAIGYVSQESIVFTGSIHDNIAYGLPDGEATREQVEEAADAAGCGFVWDLERGFDTPVTKTSLSGGQKQRISIARALVRKPRILLLDEATSALDTASEQHVNQAIARILETKEITVILVAHRLSSIAMADRVVLIDRGEVVEDGSYDDLSTDPESRFAKLMSAQINQAH